MSEMIDRVAKAIEDAMCRDPCLPDVARAAIEAMREPTEAMRKQGVAAVGLQSWQFRSQIFMGDGWRAMIDEALADDPHA